MKLAVGVMFALSVLLAVGTFIESEYNAEAAVKLVYQTFIMKFFLGWLALILVAVMVERWPWRKRHLPFLLAHIGIILILSGSWVTEKFGLDGLMRIELNGSNRFVTTHQTDVTVLQSDNGFQFNEIFKKEVDFFLEPPGLETPFRTSSAHPDIQIVDYRKYVIARKQLGASADSISGAGLRYHLSGTNIEQTDWLVQAIKSESVSQDLGPLEIVFSPSLVDRAKQNAIVLIPGFKGIRYFIFHKTNSQPFSQGELHEGEAIDLGLMGLKFRVLSYYPEAEESWEIIPKEKPSPQTTSAIKVKYQGREKWMLLNETLRLNNNGIQTHFMYSQRRKDIGLSIQLKKFEMERYQGSRKIASYKSLVVVPGHGEHVISMNKPLSLNGLAFYQASFQEAARNEVSATILSVNHDPGRWLKYLGALMLSLGIFMLFYFKKYF